MHEKGEQSLGQYRQIHLSQRLARRTSLSDTTKWANMALLAPIQANGASG